MVAKSLHAMAGVPSKEIGKREVKIKSAYEEKRDWKDLSTSAFVRSDKMCRMSYS